jgi:hypothetical protein
MSVDKHAHTTYRTTRYQLRHLHCASQPTHICAATYARKLGVNRNIEDGVDSVRHRHQRRIVARRRRAGRYAAGKCEVAAGRPRQHLFSFSIRVDYVFVCWSCVITVIITIVYVVVVRVGVSLVDATRRVFKHTRSSLETGLIPVVFVVVVVVSLLLLLMLLHQSRVHLRLKLKRRRS